MAEQPASDPALIGILALLAADRTDANPEPGTATEVILHRTGLSRADIAKVVGKSADATRKVIERAEKASSGGRGGGKK